MHMFLKSDFVVTKISLAIYVERGCGTSGKSERPFHGIVLNVSEYEKEYIFENGERIKVGKNEMLYLPKSSTYRIQTECSGDCFAINFDLLDDAVFSPFRFLPKNVSAYRRQFERAVNLYKQKEGAYLMQCRIALYEILSQMQSESHREYMSRSTVSKIAPAVEYIHQHYTEEIKISTLASLCDISEDYLRKIFHNTYQTTPVKYINELKMQYAKELLATGEYSVGEAALLSGFEDAAYLSREFHRVFGVTPAKYKEIQ